jgi:hypothetical protein
MNFNEAIKQLIIGKKVRRNIWDITHYWEIVEGQLVNSLNETPKINKKQLLTDDWEVVDYKRIPMDDIELKQSLRNIVNDISIDFDVRVILEELVNRSCKEK